MNYANSLDQKKLKARQLGFCLAYNMIGIVLAVRGVVLMTKGASAGIGFLTFGVVMLVLAPWIQDGIRDSDTEWAPPALWTILMTSFAMYQFIRVINPLI